jgi:hypothetical protein
MTFGRHGRCILARVQCSAQIVPNSVHGQTCETSIQAIWWPSLKIVDFYSHLNGWEFLQVHERELWSEITQVIGRVDAAVCRTKASKKALRMRNMLQYRNMMSLVISGAFKALGWEERRTNYWTTSDVGLTRRTIPMSAARQKAEIEAADLTPISSYNRIDMIKNRISIGTPFDEPSHSRGLFVKHLSCYLGDIIDVGVEILPMKELQVTMSSGVSYYEGELYNLIREGRGVPGVPLVLVGIAP